MHPSRTRGRPGSRAGRAVRVCALVAACIGCQSVPLEDRPWLVVNTAHFQILSDADESRSTEIAQRFEQFHAFMMKMTGIEDFEPRIPTRVYLLTDASAYQQFGRPRTLGFFRATPAANYIVIGSRGGISETRVAFHEYSHYILRSGGLFGYPTWFDEGHAELVSTVRFAGDTLEFGRPPRDRAELLRRYGSLPLRRVLLGTDVYRWPPLDNARFYADSWLLLHFFYFSEMLDGAPLWKRNTRFLQLLNQGMDGEAAFEEAFGENIGAMQRKLRTYAKGTLPYLSFPEGSFARAQPARTRTADPVEVALDLAELDLVVGKSEAAARRIERSFALVPDSARAHRLRGIVLSAQGRPGEARAAFERAIALEPDTPEHRIAYANALIGLAIQRRGDLRPVPSPLPRSRRQALQARAREQYERALTIAPDSPAARLGLAQTYLGPDADPKRAVREADRAFSLLPSDPTVALILTEALIAADRGEEARLIATRLRASAETSELNAYLDALIAETDSPGPETPAARSPAQR